MERARHLLIFAFIILGLESAASQTKWFKYDGNPVMTLGASGAWDDASVYPCRIIKRDSSYVMWYTGQDGTYWRTGLATSRDGVTWVKSPQNPILREGPASWESAGSSEPYVIYEGYRYEMWYRGEDFSANWRIGYAYSDDGINWIKADSVNPVMSNGSWYMRGPNAPCVFTDIRSQAMWFTGEPMAHSAFQIGVAYGYGTTMSTVWEPDTTPALSYGSPGAWDDDKVFFPRVDWNDSGFLEMWYCGERNDGSTQIGYATTPDGRTWTKHPDNPVLSPGPKSWDAQDLYGLDILESGNVYHMWYGGMNAFPSNPSAIGYAISPKGLTFAVTPTRDLLDRNLDVVKVIVRVADPSELSFFVEFECPDDHPVYTLRLYDDGAHGDSLAGDGVYANSWVPGDNSYYYLDLGVTLHDTLNFQWNNFKLYSPVVFAEEAGEIKPSQYELAQNYPNPFNPNTTIQYTVGGVRSQGSGVSNVRLLIYDVIGREVAELVNERQVNGTYRVNFNGARLASGVYFCQLKVGNWAVTKPMLLLK